MHTLLPVFILIPLLGFGISLFVPERKEGLLSNLAFGTLATQLLALLAFLVAWFMGGAEVLNLKELVVYSDEGYEFFVDFLFDRISAVYLFTGGFIVMLVTVYSRYYLHREEGYKRFFNTVLFFYTGYTIVVLAGNLETLFIGWEILGVASFLLIAFYRNRYLPVKNAIKVFSVYRIGDVGLILAMWMSHHLWHENITFLKLSNYELVHHHLESHTWVGVFISLMILVTAAAKSAQLPFSSWLPRAMEGPTPSSAIFYGSLSVHIGAFLLMRTFHFWEHQTSIRILIGVLGLSTSVIASSIARVQSSVKTQVAYSSMAQIGLIFVEIAAGLEVLALIHFAGNAFLRTYQLLVSPSVVSYLIRDQFYHFEPRKATVEDSLPRRIEYSMYMLSVKEWNLESLMYRSWWNPMKRLGRKLNFLTVSRVLAFFVPVYGAGLFLTYHQDRIPETLHHALPLTFSIIGVMMVLKAFSEKKDTLLAWLLVIMNHCWVALAVSFNEHFTFTHVHLYLSGILLPGIAGFWILDRLRRRDNPGLNHFHGLSSKYPRLAFGFLLMCLSLSGFPITPTFVGEDLIFSHIHSNQVLLALLTAVSFIIDGLAIIRIYARVFMGPRADSFYYRSA
jgi:NADH:ubiquinone oxidoreductase subunit 5 (subunit L)/multisubunit Na+/H+ antiporter MnhA subunit